MKSNGHPTYGELYTFLEAHQLHDGKFTHTRTFCRKHGLNFFTFRYKMQAMGAQNDHDIIAVVKPQRPGSSPISLTVPQHQQASMAHQGVKA